MPLLWNTAPQKCFATPEKPEPLKENGFPITMGYV